MYSLLKIAWQAKVSLLIIIFEEYQLNSSRFPVFPGAISNFKIFPGFPGRTFSFCFTANKCVKTAEYQRIWQADHWKQVNGLLFWLKVAVDDAKAMQVVQGKSKLCKIELDIFLSKHHLSDHPPSHEIITIIINVSRQWRLSSHHQHCQWQHHLCCSVIQYWHTARLKFNS